MSASGRWKAALVLAGVGMCAASSARAATGARGDFTCRAAETAGLPEADITHAVALLCEALARKTGGAGDFRVTIGPLGRSIVLMVTDASSRASRSILVPDLDETPTAAARLAEALVEGREVEQTQRLGQLLPVETVPMREKRGTLKLTVGALGVSALAQNTGSGGGGGLGLSYDTPRTSIFGEMLGGGSSNRDRSAGLFSMAAGLRYSLSDGSIAPYVGGGAGLLRVSLDEGWHSGSFRGSKTSFAPHVEAGVQVFRLHRARLGLGARVYLPLSSIPGDERYDGYGQPRPTRPEPSDRYVVPVVFGMQFAFGG